MDGSIGNFLFVTLPKSRQISLMTNLSLKSDSGFGRLHSKCNNLTMFIILFDCRIFECSTEKRSITAQYCTRCRHRAVYHDRAKSKVGISMSPVGTLCGRSICSFDIIYYTALRSIDSSREAKSGIKYMC